MQNNKLFSSCNIYIFLWIVYSLQSIIFGAYGTIYSKLILAFLLTVSVYYMFYAYVNYKLPIYFKGLVLMIIMFTVYGLLLILSPTRAGRASNYVYLQYIYNSLLPIFPFYVFTRKGWLNKTNLLWWIIILFVVVTIQYFQHQREYLQMLAEEGREREEFTNNFGYEFLSMIPLLAFFSKKKIIQYFGLGYVMVFVIFSMKRGAMLIAVVCIMWFVYCSMKNARNNKKIIVIVLSIVVIYVGYYYVQSLMENSDYFNQRLQSTLEGDTSGREVVYANLLQHFLGESSPLRFLFGNGANATLRIVHMHAHNDWLELAINQGLLGIIVYVLYWLGFYKTYRKSKFDDEIVLAVSLLLISCLIRSFFSMSYGDMSRCTTLCIGYCMGMISEHEKKS